MSEIINSKDWAKTYKACNFIEKGVCEYSDERVYLSQETLMRCSQSLKGRPVVIGHVRGITPDNMQRYAVGYVTKVGSDCDGFSCDFVVFDDAGNQVILDGYSVSCAYKPLAFTAGGTWHNVPYAREITDLKFTHLALVKNPRYEDAKVYENSKNGDKDGHWITIKGTHVFVKDGQTVKEAMKKTFKDSSSEKSKQQLSANWEKSLYSNNWQLYTDKFSASVDAMRNDGYSVKVFDAEGHNTNVYKECATKKEAMEWAEIRIDELNKQQDILKEKRLDVAKEAYSRDKGLKGKYAKEDADFDVQQMKKDIETAQELGYKEVEDIAEFLGLDDDEVRETLAKSSNEKSEYKKALEKVEYDKVKEQKKRFDKLPPAESKGQEKARKVVKRELDKKLSEKNNSKEEDMNFDEFFNKMGEMLEEKLNSCKSKMNAEEEQDNDDKFEMDGETYSKKELVNAFKEKKNAEEAAAKKEEEEKQNGLDAFKQMEEKMNSRPEGYDKIEIYSQKAGLERGKAIYGK